MSYIVMECHPAYVILMDEASNFVKAANLHYTVGQTVTDPILMEQTVTQNKPNIRMILGTIAAAAACLTLVSVGGYRYYAKNLKTESVVMISTEAQFRMGVNRKGEVVYIESEDEYGSEILETYDGKGKDSMTVANELLEIEKAKGYLNDGDTFDMYISADDSESYDALKTDFEKEISELNLNVHVHASADDHKPPKAGDGKPQPPKADELPTPDEDKQPPHAEDAPEPPTPPTDAEAPTNSEDNKPPHPQSEDTPALLPSEDDAPQPKKNDDAPVAEPPVKPDEPPVKPEKQDGEPDTPADKPLDGVEILPPHPVNPPKADRPQPEEAPMLPVSELESESFTYSEISELIAEIAADSDVLALQTEELLPEKTEIEKISEKNF